MAMMRVPGRTEGMKKSRGAVVRQCHPSSADGFSGRSLSTHGFDSKRLANDTPRVVVVAKERSGARGVEAVARVEARAADWKVERARLRSIRWR